MDALTRRRFLLASGVGGAGVLAAGAGAWSLSRLLRTADPDAAADDGRTTLVVLTLYGGNDGLNTVIPYADPAYHSLRPDLAYAQEKVLRLDERFGLNPVMQGLARLWPQRRIAIVHGVGYPHPDRSHFRSMDIWQTASPEAPISTGWIGRWLDGTKYPAEYAVSVEPVLPPLMVGATRAGACVSINGLKLPEGIDAAAVEGLGAPEPGESDMRARAATGYADLLKVDQLVRSAESATDPSAAADQPEITVTGTGGANTLAPQFDLVARCIEARVPTRVYSVSLGGFDTHATERPGHERLLKQLDQTLTAFLERMGKSPAGRRVTVLVYSEFGRRVRANASDGTDHGTAGPVMVLGHGVAGGFHGEHAKLTDLDSNGDLKATVDFRDVFGTVLASVLGAEPERYLAGHKVRPLPLFTAG
jgi:uncharacterized protein (DUF1501 family)